MVDGRLVKRDRVKQQCLYLLKTRYLDLTGVRNPRKMHIHVRMTWTGCFPSWYILFQKLALGLKTGCRICKILHYVILKFARTFRRKEKMYEKVDWRDLRYVGCGLLLWTDNMLANVLNRMWTEGFENEISWVQSFVTVTDWLKACKNENKVYTKWFKNGRWFDWTFCYVKKIRKITSLFKLSHHCYSLSFL